MCARLLLYYNYILLFCVWVARQSVPDNNQRTNARHQRAKIDRMRQRKVNRALVIIKTGNNKTKAAAAPRSAKGVFDCL